MTDERLVTGLTAWLQDSENPAPDSRMSAGRVMAGVESTSQLGRRWPPARFVPAARPVPALGAAGPGVAAGPAGPAAPAAAAPLPMPTQPTLPTPRGVRSMFTATRILAAAVVLALVGGSFLVVPRLLPGPTEPAAVAVPSPPPSAAASVPPSPTPEPSPSPTPEPSEPPDPATSAESVFAATGLLTELEPEADPTSLSRGPFGSAVFIDRSTGRIHVAGPDGYPMILATAGEPDPDSGMSEPVIAVGGGSNVYAFDSEGQAWWNSRDDQSEAPWVARMSGEPDGGAGQALDADRIDPATTAFAIFSHLPKKNDLYLAEPGSGDIVRYDFRRNHIVNGSDGRIEREGLSEVLGLATDPQLWVLTEDSVEHWVDGARDESFTLAALPDGEPDFRFISNTGSDGKGQLWLYDAAGLQVVAFDKRDGSYDGSWAPAPDEPAMADVRGMYVENRGAGAGSVVTWLTPRGVMRSAVSEPAAIESKPDPHAGGLEPSAREPGAPSIVWTAKDVSLEADAVQIRVGDKLFSAPGEVLAELDDGATDASLEMTWYERGTEMRLFIYMANDSSHWWIYDLWTYDGVKGNGEWIYYDDLSALTRTPLGQPLEGDLRLESTGANRKEFRKDGTGKLRIDGLRLTAFPPRVRPAPLTGCEYLEQPDLDPEDGRPSFDWMQGPGEPMEGIKDMTPAEAEMLLQEMGVCHRFDHSYRLAKPFKSKKLNQHFYDWATDTRCSAPEHGTVEFVSFGEDHRAGGSDGIIAKIHVRDEEIRDLPEPPPQGTDCVAG